MAQKRGAWPKASRAQDADREGVRLEEGFSRSREGGVRAENVHEPRRAALIETNLESVSYIALLRLRTRVPAKDQMRVLERFC